MYLTFGKYRNNSVKDVVEKDKKYSEWLMSQPWFTIKHKELYHLFKIKYSIINKCIK